MKFHSFVTNQILPTFTAIPERSVYSVTRILEDSDVHVDVHRRTLPAQHDYSYSLSRVHLYKDILLCRMDCAWIDDSRLAHHNDTEGSK